MQPEEEASLLHRSRQGDLDAFNRLVELYQRPLYNLCLRLLASPQAAEDATQDAFLAAFRAINRFRGGSLRAWLFRIAANACYDQLRRLRSRPSLSLDARPDQSALQLPHPGEPLEERAQRLELARCLGDALAALPPDQRLVILLRDVHGLPYEEIAQAAGISLGTVKSRLSRARNRLRQLLLARGELLPARFRPSSEGS